MAADAHPGHHPGRGTGPWAGYLAAVALSHWTLYRSDTGSRNDADPALSGNRPGDRRGDTTFPFATDAEVAEALATATEAFAAWRLRPVAERAAVVKRIAELFTERATDLAALITKEMGKRPAQAVGEAEFCTDIFNYYADNGPGLVANKHGDLGTDGSVSFLFKHCGQLVFAPGTSEDKVMEAAIDAGAEDVIGNDDGSVEVITPPNDFLAVKGSLEKAGLKSELAEVTMKPTVENALTGDDAVKMQKLLDALEALDDVQEVYTTAVLERCDRAPHDRQGPFRSSDYVGR